MAFGRKDSSCPRCQELIAGAKPRAGWNNRRDAEAAARTKAIAEHDFVACMKQNVCCTCFDN